MFGRKKIAMIVAEFLGTGILTAVVLAVSKSSIGIPYFVSIAAGLAIAAGTLAFGGVSGANFNPAITLGLWSVGRLKTLKAVVYIAAQLLGGILAYLLYTYFVNQHWNNAGHFTARMLAGEATGGFVFSLAWATAVFRKLDNTKAAATVGIGLMLGVVVASSASGGIVNPAVALGLRSWVWGSYVLGPVLGALIGFNLYALLFAPSDSDLAAETAKPAKKK